MSSNYFKLGVATAGIYACYLAYGIFQETLYKVQEDGSVFAATAFLMMFQCVVNALLSLVVDAYKTAGDKDQWKWIGTLTSKEVVGTSIVYVSAMYMSNEALQYVSYPTQALAKSCKMIPVLIGRVFINGERYGWMKYVCVLLMTIGIAMFQMWGGKKKGGSHGAAPVEGFGGEGYGMFLLVISLVFDGIGGPFQEKLKGMHLSNTQQIVVNNVWAAALMMLVSLFYGEFWSAVSGAGHAAAWHRMARGRVCRRGYRDMHRDRYAMMLRAYRLAHLLSSLFLRVAPPSLQLSYIRTHPAILQALVAFSMCSGESRRSHTHNGLDTRT